MAEYYRYIGCDTGSLYVCKYESTDKGIWIKVIDNQGHVHGTMKKLCGDTSSIRNLGAMEISSKEAKAILRSYKLCKLARKYIQ